MRCNMILGTCYEGSVLVISAFCALVESGLDIKMIICIHKSRQTSSERGTLVGIEDKMPSTLSSKYLDYFFREHYNRQHCRLNICWYIAWVDKYWVSEAKIQITLLIVRGGALSRCGQNFHCFVVWSWKVYCAVLWRISVTKTKICCNFGNKHGIPRNCTILGWTG